MMSVHFKMFLTAAVVAFMTFTSGMLLQVSGRHKAAIVLVACSGVAILFAAVVGIVAIWSGP